MTEILNFIEDIKKTSPKEITNLFSCGYCYWFAVILSTRFNGSIFYLPIENHFITKINNNFYDIKGLYKPKEDIYLWPDEYTQTDKLDYERVCKYCINKERDNEV